ncbi:hypothetical protein CORT_0G02280 [Candida orthopsilosis Co 90-125]|uniref:Uncharacterized protein n=1 Tax=Candida orthopsilosis (strain 90-125) TaxID=1136231 RepID=H8XAQ8_CANO9|nr:hypothetical protein CORT_0G02280 [Candida orthopsilosis Co 90-125]CCG24909.1 hypothetical protein CORT_0G02280 [Candida orthopsilosis Co 90-125]
MSESKPLIRYSPPRFENFTETPKDISNETNMFTSVATTTTTSNYSPIEDAIDKSIDDFAVNYPIDDFSFNKPIDVAFDNQVEDSVEDVIIKSVDTTRSTIVDDSSMTDDAAETTLSAEKAIDEAIHLPPITDVTNIITSIHTSTESVIDTSVDNFFVSSANSFNRITGENCFVTAVNNSVAADIPTMLVTSVGESIVDPSEYSLVSITGSPSIERNEGYKTLIQTGVNHYGIKGEKNFILKYLCNEMVSTPGSHFKFLKKYLDSTSASTDSKFDLGIDEVPSFPNALGIDEAPPTLNVPSTMDENFSNSNVLVRDTRSNRKAIYGFPFLKIIWSNVIDTMKNSYQALKLNFIPTSNSRNTN